MKNLLLPISSLLFFCCGYYGVYLTTLMFIYSTTISWLWLIIGGGIFLSIFGGLIIIIPSIVIEYCTKFYKNSWISVLFHTISGGAGLFLIFKFFSENPIVYKPGEFFYKTLLNVMPVKTIYLTFYFFGAFWVIIVLLFLPIYLKITNKNIDEDF